MRGATSGGFASQFFRDANFFPRMRVIYFVQITQRGAPAGSFASQFFRDANFFPRMKVIYFVQITHIGITKMMTRLKKPKVSGFFVSPKTDNRKPVSDLCVFP